MNPTKELKVKSPNLIVNQRLGYIIEPLPGGHRPKTGFLICRSIPADISLNNVLEIGTGETAAISIHLAKMGAKKITAIDIRDEAINWAKRNISANSLDEIISAKKISIFDYKVNEKYDLIVSNPPQMPVQNEVSEHDDGGHDGRKVIDYLVQFANSNLSQYGNIVFSAFDFIGSDENSDGEKNSIKAMLKSSGFSFEILSKNKKEIRRDGYTYKNLHWLEKKFPEYNFSKGYYYVNVIRARKI